MDVYARFRDELGSQVVEEFNKLAQVGSIDEYLEKFKELKSLMQVKNPLLPIDYFVDCFVGGLSPQIKSFTRAFKPQTLNAAVDYARLQEATIQAMKVPDKTRPPPPSKPFNQRGLLPTPAQNTLKPQYVQGIPTQSRPRTITAAERAEKLAKGLCFFCDQTYEKGHQCNNRKTQLFLIEIPGVDEEESGDDLEGREGMEFQEEENPQISINALSGLPGFQTMRVTGMYGKSPLHILLDSGSTHNFLDISMAKKLGCTIEETPVQAVTVADGNRLHCLHICKKFKWRLHNAEFESDMMLIPLGSCDMVLGVQWLSQLGTVRWNFKKLQLEYTYQGQNHVLRGIKSKKVQLISTNKLQRILQNTPEVCMLQIIETGQWPCEFNGLQQREKSTHDPHLQALLQQYEDVFAEPSCLPPSIGLFDGYPWNRGPILSA